MARLLALWTLAVALAALGTAVLFDACPGLNWGIFAAATAGAILLSARLGRVPVSSALVTPLGLAATLGVASDWQYRNLMVEMSALGYRTSEPSNLVREDPRFIPGIVAHLCEHGYRREQLADTAGLLP